MLSENFGRGARVEPDRHDFTWISECRLTPLLAQRLSRWNRARVLVKDVLDGPNTDIDRIIRAIRDNHWQVSNKLRADFPMIDSAGLESALIDAVKSAFASLSED